MRLGVLQDTKQNTIEKQVNKLASEFFGYRFNDNANDKSLALSKVCTQVTIKNMLDLDENEAFDSMTVYKNDFVIDSLYFSEL